VRRTPEKWAWNSRFLMHDNMHVHRSFMVKKYLAMHNVMVSTLFPTLVTASLFPVSMTKGVLKGQWFASTEEVTGKATTALTDVMKNCFQECFQKLYKHWQKCVSLQKETTLNEYNVNRCKVTRFCVTNKFWELSAADMLMTAWMNELISLII
jgi:hypothetical protein